MSKSLFVTQLCATVLAIFAVSVNIASAQSVINDFDSGLESWRTDFGGSTYTVTHDPTEGSPGNPMGAAKMTFDFPNGGVAFTADLFNPAVDLTALGSVLSYDIKVDIANSSQDSTGAYGFLQMVSRETGGYTWGGQPGLNLLGNSGNWQTFSIDTSLNGGLDMTATRALTLQIYGGNPRNIPGDVTVWLDNVRVVSAVPEPGSLSLLALVGMGVMARRRR